MTTFSPAARRTRRALAGLGIVAASMLLVAPVAGAERPGTATVAQSDRSDGGPSAHSSAPSESQPEVVPGDSASPSSDDTGRHEHALCHRTGSAVDPYVQVTVAFRTAGGVVSSEGGHERHDGPVFDPATMGDGDTWGDIIPSFTTADGVSYEGKNWPAGKATFDNGCEPVAATNPADQPVTDGDAVPDRAEAPANPEDEPSEEARDGNDEMRLDLEDPEDGSTERAVSRTRRPDRRVGQGSAGAGGSAGAVEERALRAGGGTGDIAAVLGQQVTRDPGHGAVVPTSGSESTLATDLARTDSSLAVLLMLGLSVLIGGYAAVDAIRERIRRAD